jgi:3-isopropylmalate/(R)-2-methylmalate dehydratase small subunit
VRIRAKVWRYGDDFNTDMVIPARYLYTADPEELASHCLEDVDVQFVKSVQSGDIIVAGKNFGCGSSREHAPIALKAIGIGCVVAPSFARIFFRNAINIGLPIVEADVSADTGDEIEVDFDTGQITNQSTGKRFASKPLPAFMQQLISAGGLMSFVKNLKHSRAEAEGKCPRC